MAGIPTSNILQPGSIYVASGVNKALVSQLQLLTPQFYKQYVEKYGSEDYTWWLSTFAGMEEVNDDTFFWFENRGKNQIAVQIANTVGTPAAGATVTLTLASSFHYNSGTQSSLRVGETLTIASNNVEGEILTVDTSTPSAHVFTVRPKKSTVAFAGPTGSLVSGETLLFGGLMDVGEASTQGATEQTHLDQKYTNTATEIRFDWTATDKAEMTEVYYQGGFTGEGPAGVSQAGTSLFTLKGLYKANVRFKNNVERKLMFGDVKNNTGLSTTTSAGSQGIIPKIIQDGETVGYTPGTLDIAKMHEITRIMDVNGCHNEALWLMDTFQRQQFSDSIFKEFPAGAYVWGSNEKSEEAAISYGVQSIMLDNYLLKVKKYKNFNTEAITGVTPTADFFRNFGVIIPQGETRDAKDASKTYKNVTVMYRNPPKGGTIGNGIRVWNWGGGSDKATDGTMKDNITQLAYRGSRVVGANQFVIVQAS